MKPRYVVDDVEYDRTNIELRTVADIEPTLDGKGFPFNHRTEIRLSTSNPALISKLLIAAQSSNRVDISIEGPIDIQASQGLIITNATYYSHTLIGQFDLQYGSPVSVHAR